MRATRHTSTRPRPTHNSHARVGAMTIHHPDWMDGHPSGSRQRHPQFTSAHTLGRPWVAQSTSTEHDTKCTCTAESKVFHMLQSSKMEDDRIRVIRRLVRQVKNHPNKDALIADLRNNRTYDPFSEDSKKMIHNMGNMECFELCEISPTFQCSSSSKYWTEGIVYCTMLNIPQTADWGEIRPTEHPVCCDQQGTRHGARHGNTEAQREYRQAKDSLKKAIRNNYSAILQRLQQHDTYTENRTKPSDGTKILADVVTISRVKTTPTSLRGTSGRGMKTTGSLPLNTQGKNGPMTVSKIGLL